MTACHRQIRPLPTTLATLAALVAIMAASSALVEGSGFERQRGWVVRTLDGDEGDARAARQLTDCLARAARGLLGARVHLVAAITAAPTIAPAAVEQAPRPAGGIESPPLRPVLIHHLALPPPVA